MQNCKTYAASSFLNVIIWLLCFISYYYMIVAPDRYEFFGADTQTDITELKKFK